MNRELTVKRIYNLGNYQNIEFTDSIAEIPQEVMLDKDLLSLIRELQFLQLELDYREYAQTFEQVNQAKNIKDQIEMIMELRETKFDEFLNQLNDKIKGEK